MKQKIKQYFSKPMNVVIFIEFLLVLLLNLFVVTTSDDLGYQINHGLIDIFKREYIQYMTWTGRTVAHIFARIFLALPKSIFDTLCTYEAKYFPTGREHGNFIELALGKKLGLSPRTWIPNPNPDKTYWRLVD